MKTLLAFVLTVALIGGLYAYGPKEVRDQLMLVNPFYRCKVPFAYSVGSVDPRFGVGLPELEKAINAAVSTWEKKLGADLFTEETTGGIKVSLVYDERQKETEQLAELDGEIDVSKETYASLKATYDAAVSSYKADKASYETALAEFESDRAAYDARAKEWNRSGGSADEYAALERERKALTAESDRLNGMREALNDKVAAVNAAAARVNAAGRKVNAIVDEYNNTGETVREEFEAGIYHEGPDGKSITVYQFEDQAKLVGVLTHEFGHALGLDHNEDKGSIMYRLHTGANQTVSDNDVSAVRAACPHLN